MIAPERDATDRGRGGENRHSDTVADPPLRFDPLSLPPAVFRSNAGTCVLKDTFEIVRFVRYTLDFIMSSRQTFILH